MNSHKQLWGLPSCQLDNVPIATAGIEPAPLLCKSNILPLESCGCSIALGGLAPPSLDFPSQVQNLVFKVQHPWLLDHRATLARTRFELVFSGYEPDALTMLDHLAIRLLGVEPSPQAWQARIIPLDYNRIAWSCRDSNPEPPAFLVVEYLNNLQSRRSTN